MGMPIFLIGNGFNFLIADILKKEIEKWWGQATPELIETEKDIREITALWKKFDDLFAELSKEYPKLTQEELLKMIHSVIDFFSRLDGLFSFVSNKEEYREYLEKLKNLINKVLLEKIIAISEEFRQHEERAGYKNIKKIFPDFGEAFGSVLKENGIDNISIFSTNYDGLLDTMLTKDGMFNFGDGFNKTERGLMFEEEQFQRCRFKLLHLHGSYKFEENYYGTEKLKKGVKNENPLMIFNNPNLKEKLIKENDTLREYFYLFENELEICSKMIIIGNSLLNEPHILKLLKKRFYQTENSREIKICVIDKYPDKVEENIRKEIKEIEIELFQTDKIENIDDFLEIMKKVLAENKDE